MELMHFRLKNIAKYIGDSIEHSIIFDLMEPEPISVELRPISDVEFKSGYGKNDIMCVADLQRKPTRKIRLWIEEPSGDRPAGFKEFSDTAFHTLADATVRALRCLRWRIGYRRARNPIRFFHSFEWSSDGDVWHSVDDAIRLKITCGLPFQRISDEIVASAVDLWRTNTDEPLAHDLFHEAWSQQDENPLSSLVIGIAAAETGMKHLISDIVPAAAWLIENIQSPPLAKMLQEYIPLLPHRIRINGAVLTTPDWLIETLKDGVFLRNDIVHGHAVTLKPDKLREILEAVNDLLYYCDLLAGQQWAIQCLSPRMSKALAGEA